MFQKRFCPRRRTLAILLQQLAAGSGLALSMPVQAATTPAPAAPSPVAQVQQLAAMVDRYDAQAKACKWNTPETDEAVEEALDLQMKHLALDGIDDKPVRLRARMLEAKPCNSPEDIAARDFGYATGFEWTLNLSALQQHGAQADWRKGMAHTADGANRVNAFINRTKTLFVAQKGEAAFQQLFGNVAQSIGMSLALECKLLDPANQACPVIPQATDKDRKLAQLHLDLLRTMSYGLAGRYEQIDKGSFGNAYHLRDGTVSIFESGEINPQCADSEYVIYPEAPDTVDNGSSLSVTLRHFKYVGDYGRLKVSKPTESTGDYELVAKESGTGDFSGQEMPVFRYCASY